MLSSQIKDCLTTSPFKTFSIVMADGRKIPVVGRDFALIAPTGRIVFVYQKDDSFDILDTLLITGLSVDKPETATAPAVTAVN